MSHQMQQKLQVAMAGRAVTRVVLRCQAAKEDGNLDLSECQLVSFPDAVYMLLNDAKIAKCDLSRNDLAKVPPQLPAKFSHITALVLSGNRLSSLPDELGLLKCLVSLDASRNDLMALPRAALRPPRVQRLDLAHNFIADVDVSRLRSCPPSLRELNLEHNPLTRTSLVRLRATLSPKVLVLVTEVTRHDDDDSDDDDGSTPNSSV